MQLLSINNSSRGTIIKSFEQIARELFCNYKIEVNNHYYRLIDIEFYYFKKGVFEDVYAHKHERQKTNGEWYFHPSGIDITFGGEECYGGILIRGIAKTLEGATHENYFIKEQIHGPLSVQTELMSSIGCVFANKPIDFRLVNVGQSKMESGMIEPNYIVQTKRIGLKESKDNSTDKAFYNGKFRFVMFFKDFNFKYKEKTFIALEMLEQFPKLEKEGVNKIMKSTFLK